MALTTDFVNRFVDPLDQFMTSGIANLADEIRNPFITLVALYIVIFGILITLGYIRSPIQDFALNVIKVSILVALITQAGTYNFYVKDFFFTQLPNGLINAIQSNGNSADISTGAIFDRIISDLIDLSGAVYEQWSWDNWYPFLVSFLIILGIIPITALLFVVLLAKLGLTLLLVVGPIFIAMFLFSPTRQFTSSWIAGLVTFVMLQVMSVVFIGLLTTITQDMLQATLALSGVEQIADAIRLVAILSLSMILAALLPSIAAQLAGSGLRAGERLIHQGSNYAQTGVQKLRDKAMQGGHAVSQRLRQGRSGGSIIRE